MCVGVRLRIDVQMSRKVGEEMWACVVVGVRVEGRVEVGRYGCGCRCVLKYGRDYECGCELPCINGCTEVVIDVDVGVSGCGYAWECLSVGVCMREFQQVEMWDCVSLGMCGCGYIRMWGTVPGYV